MTSYFSGESLHLTGGVGTGAFVGPFTGAFVGPFTGALVGLAVPMIGCLVGDALGTADGLILAVGFSVGKTLG